MIAALLLGVLVLDAALGPLRVDPRARLHWTGWRGH